MDGILKYYLDELQLQRVKQPKCIYYNKEISKSDNKVKTIWKIVKDKTGTHSMVEENPSIKINNNVINSTKIIANSFTT
jgi:hypothetical protein